MSNQPTLEDCIAAMIQDTREAMADRNLLIPEEEIIEFATAIATLTWNFGIKHKLSL